MAPRTLLRFPATMDPSDALSPSAVFPVYPVMRLTFLRRFLSRARRASPVARRVLVTVLPLPPRRRDLPHQPFCERSCCLRRKPSGSASGACPFRGYLCVHFRCGPVTRSPALSWLHDGLQVIDFSPPCHRCYWGMAFPLTGLLPAGRVSLGWTHGFIGH